MSTEGETPVDNDNKGEILPEDEDNKLNELSYEEKFRREYVPEIYGTDENLTWNQCVRGFFTKSQAECMRKKNLNLSSYDQVSGRIDDIIGMVSLKTMVDGSVRSRMPPDGPWPEEKIELLKAWSLKKPKCPKGQLPDTSKEHTKIMKQPPSWD